ncbi:MAG: prolipoprotein diacylglyceryl transferase [Sandaracinaceae bacterium]
MYPVLLEIPTPWGPVPVQSYGTLLALSLVAGWALLRYMGAARGADRRVLDRAFVVSVLAGVLGARLLYVLTDPGRFAGVLDALDPRHGGLVAYGGFVGGLLGAAAALRWTDRAAASSSTAPSLAAFGDLAAPGLALGLGLTRIGCYLFGCDYGRPLGDGAPAWLRQLGTFPRWPDGSGSPPFLHHVARYGLSPFADASLPVHPAQLYASAAGFVLLAVALGVGARRRFEGEVLLSVTALYAAWRFVVELVRDDPERGQVLGLSTSQAISLVLFPVAVLLYARLALRARSARGAPPEAATD